MGCTQGLKLDKLAFIPISHAVKWQYLFLLSELPDPMWAFLDCFLIFPALTHVYYYSHVFRTCGLQVGGSTSSFTKEPGTVMSWLKPTPSPRLFSGFWEKNGLSEDRRKDSTPGPALSHVRYFSRVYFEGRQLRDKNGFRGRNCTCRLLDGHSSYPDQGTFFSQQTEAVTENHRWWEGREEGREESPSRVGHG